MKMFRFLFLILFPVVSATLSAECGLGLSALYDDGALLAKQDELNVDFLQNLDTDEICEVEDKDTARCVFDYSPVSDALEPLCEEVRGSWA